VVDDTFVPLLIRLFLPRIESKGSNMGIDMPMIQSLEHLIM
jgi:hypothetical protein